MDGLIRSATLEESIGKLEDKTKEISHNAPHKLRHRKNMKVVNGKSDEFQHKACKSSRRRKKIVKETICKVRIFQN